MRFRVIDVPGAGNCMFEAVGRTLGVGHAQLRAQATQWMQVENQTLHGEPLQAWVVDGSVSAYAAHMQRLGVWGGGIELAILATLYKRPILVFTQSSSNRATQVAEFLPDKMDAEAIAQATPVCILYVGNAHYMQLEFISG